MNTSKLISALLLLSLGFGIYPLAQAAGDDGPLEANRHDFAAVMRGARLFQSYCASCHGEGARGGLVPRANVPAPALNGTAHAWHHPLPDLLSTIEFGSVARGGYMPPWRSKLSTRQMLDIIAWFQSRWPDEIYARWQKRDRCRSALEGGTIRHRYGPRSQTGQTMPCNRRRNRRCDRTGRR